MRTILHFAAIAVPVLVSGCAHHYSGSAAHADSYGFFSGIWHGMILPYSVLVNLLSWALGGVGIEFLADVQIIGRPNTGFFYYLGFLLGLSAYSSAGTQRSRPTGAA